MARSRTASPTRPVAPPALYWASFVAVGLAVTILGPALTELMERTGAGIADIGVLFVGLAIGNITGSLFLGRLYDRFDGHRVFSSALMMITAGVLLATTVATIPLLMLAFMLVGAGASTADVGANLMLMWQLGPRVARAMNLLHLSFGIGALSAPLLVYAGAALWVAAGLTAAAAFAASRFAAPSAPAVARDEQGDTTVPLLAVLAAFFVLYVGLEVGFGGWVATYGEEIGLSEKGAAWLTTVFWVGFNGGRAAAAWIGDRVLPKYVLAWSCIATVVVAGFLLVGQGHIAATFVASTLMGVATAAQFPMMFTYLERRIVVTGAATSVFIAAAGVGALVFPWLIGQWFAAIGPSAVPWSMLILGTATLAIFAVANRLLRPATPTSRVA